MGLDRVYYSWRKRWIALKRKTKDPERPMNHRDFSILGEVLPMHRLLNVRQGGVPPQGRVKQVQRQRATSVKREEPQVHDVVQGVRPQAINAGREARHRGAPNVEVAVVQERSVRLGLVWANKCRLCHTSNRKEWYSGAFD